MKSLVVVVTVLAVGYASGLAAQDVASKGRQVWSEASALVSTKIHVPEDFDSTREYPLLIALHGFGSSADLFGRIASHFTERGFVVAVPEGAYSVGVEDRVGRDWFLHQPPTEWSDLRLRALQLVARSQLPSVLAEVKREHEISKAYLLGFSQGGIVAYYSGITHHDDFDGIVIFGSLMDAEWMDSSTLAEGNRVPVLIFQGTEDELVPAWMSESTRDLLLSHGYDVTYREFSGGHRVPPELLHSVTDWIQAKAPWPERLDYAPETLHSIRVQEYGYPFVEVTLQGDTVWLPYDTGNMVGITISKALLSQLKLPCSTEWDRLDSAGRVVSIGCTAHGVAVELLGRARDSVSVFEFVHEQLPGLVGPGSLPGSRFALDYAGRVLAVDDRETADVVTGFTPLPLVVSPRHRRLILVRGRVEGHDVLMEIDTGKSRTTIDRELVELLGLDEGPRGVALESVQLGSREWSVESARVVNTSGISEGLPSRIALGVGSDVLSTFVFAVDYGLGRFYMEDPASASERPDGH